MTTTRQGTDAPHDPHGPPPWDAEEPEEPKVRAALAWIARSTARGWRFRVTQSDDGSPLVQFGRAPGAPALLHAERDRAALAAERDAHTHLRLAEAMRRRDAARARWDATVAPWLRPLGEVAHELTSVDRERMASCERERDEAVGRGDGVAAYVAAVRWVWAAHPLRWLPHGDHEGVRRAGLARLYEQERRARVLHRWGAWTRLEEGCEGARCGGACRPYERRVWVVPGGGEAWGCPALWADLHEGSGTRREAVASRGAERAEEAQGSAPC